MLTLVVVILMVSNIGVTSVNALDLSKYGLGSNIGQSVGCVIVVVGCDSTGSASSGNTIIGSNNGNDINFQMAMAALKLNMERL